jgi:hypothetical protein
MRKYIVLLLAVVFGQNAFAQAQNAYKEFTMDLGFGVAVEPKGATGFLMYLEPGYTIAEQFKPGVRFEQTMSNMKYTSSSLLTFDYYLTRRPGVRVSAGGGYGFFNTGEIGGGCGGGPYFPQTTRTSKNTGSMVRMGLELHHLHLGVEYNFAPATKVTTPATTDKLASTAVYQNAYWGLKASVIIGGGKKKMFKRGQ